MTAEIIDGKLLAREIRDNLSLKIRELKRVPSLSVILVGDDEASKIYVHNKQKTALEIGTKCEVFELPESTTEKDLKALIERLNNDNGVDGILIQLPLPSHINSLEIISLISPSKDVDGFSPYNTGMVQIGSQDAIVAATPKGILAILNSVMGDLSGKHAVIIGRSNIVGKPLVGLLLNQDCTLSVTHSKTKNIQEITKTADILISACGVPGLIKKSWVKEGGVVIDVGISRVDGKICGDTDFNEVSEVASYITPVPGGVGPMTIAMLLDNLYNIAAKRNQ